MQPEQPAPAAPVDPLDPDTTPFPVATYRTSGRLGWSGLQAIRFHNPPGSVISLPPMTHHTLVLFRRPPRRFELRTEGVRRSGPPPAESLVVVPAGNPARWGWEGPITSLHVFLEPGVVERAAAEAFGLDPARLEIPPLDAAYRPPLRATMLAVGEELSGGGGGGLAIESLANLLAVHLVRQASRPRTTAGGDGRMPGSRLNAVIEYVEGHLDEGLTLAGMAGVVGLSPYHFARQFKAAAGVAPHQFVTARRVARARDLLLTGDIPLADVAVRCGFSDQSRLTLHFKRSVGVAPGRFRSMAAAETPGVCKHDSC